MAIDLLKAGPINDQRRLPLCISPGVRKPNHSEDEDGAAASWLGRLDSLQFVRKSALGADANARIAKGAQWTWSAQSHRSNALLLAAQTADIALL
ncbi:MAG: hypothetical protein U1G07_05300 [Verrucomicrobiota bacterium]